MSHASITQCTRDRALLDRVVAATMREALANPTFGDTEFGKQVQRNPVLAEQALIWPVAIDYEDEYEYALNVGNPDPGGDTGVITDANISSAVQVHWPPDTVPEPPQAAV